MFESNRRERLPSQIPNKEGRITCLESHKGVFWSSIKLIWKSALKNWVMFQKHSQINEG